MSSTFPDPDEERNAAEGPFPGPIPKRYGTRIHEQIEQYISDEATGADPWVSGSIMIDPSDAGATGVYNKMVHRETDGPDPLVPEP